MNSFAYLQTFKTFLNAGDMAALSIDDKLTLITALNEALVEWFSLCPSPARTRSITDAVLPAPQSIEVTATNGSSDITFTTPPPASQIGSTIYLSAGGDSTQNHLVSLTKLHMPFTGTTGTFMATLYGDAFALPAGFEAFTSKVICALPAGLTFELRPWAEITQVQPRNAWIFPTWTYGTQPTHYKLVTGQSLDGTPPFYVLRVWPAPAQTYKLEFEYTGHARPFTVSDFATARTLDLRDQHWGPIRRLTLAKLITSGLLKSTIDRRDLREDAQAAAGTIANTPVAGTGSPTRMGTPKNW